MKEEIIQWLREWFEENGKGCNAVVSISGGKDSTVCAALCVEALGKDRVIGVLQPDGEQVDIADSYKVCDLLGIRHITININKAKGALMEALLFQTNSNFAITEITEQAVQNLPPRLRMATVYLVSQCMNGRVINTCNLSETLLGWETRWGDAVGDIALLADFTVQEVKELGYELGLPKELIDKTPSDGLCGKSDEDKMGISYKVLDTYIREGIEGDKEMMDKIHKRVKENMFKHKPIPYFHTGKSNYIAEKQQ